MAGFQYSMDTIHAKDVGRLYNFSVQISNFDIIHEEMIVGVTTPKQTIEPLPVYWTSGSFNVPGKVTFEPITLTIRDNDDGVIYKEFYKWANEIINISPNASNTNKYTSPKKFAETGKTITITQLKHDGTEGFKYVLDHAWPMGLPTIQYTYEGGAIVQYDIELDYLNFKAE